VEQPGKLEQGSYEFPFTFKNLDLAIDSYIGVGLSVEYSVNAVMIYTGSMMKYTCKNRQAFSVRNYSRDNLKSEMVQPSVKFVMQGHPSVTLEVKYDKTRLNCETDWVSGWVRGKECKYPERLKAVKIQLLQKEILGFST
jgi:hypothetical protein